MYEYDTEIQGFIGLNDEYVEGIFVSGEMQSQGIGKILLNYAKDKRNKLHLNVYQKNARAILVLCQDLVQVKMRNFSPF